MPSFKWDDASDRLMLLAYLETTNSMPRDYEPIALVLGPQVSTKMVHARLQKLLGEAAAARQVATNFIRTTSSNEGRKRTREVTTSDAESEEEERVRRKRSKKKAKKRPELEVLVTSAPVTDQGTRQSDTSDNPSKQWRSSRQPPARPIGKDEGRQFCRTTEDTNTQASSRGKRGRQENQEAVNRRSQQALNQTGTVTALAARTRATSHRRGAERATIANVTSQELSHATENHPQSTQPLRTTTVVNAETVNPQSPIGPAHLSQPVSPIPPTYPPTMLGQARTFDKDQRNAERAGQPNAEHGWRLTSGGEVISDGASEGVVSSSSSVKEQSNYSDDKDVGDNSDEDSNMEPVKEEEVDNHVVPSPEGPVTTQLQLRSVKNPKKATLRLAWAGPSRKGKAHIVKLPKHICKILSRNKRQGVLRIQKEAGAERVTLNGYTERAKVNESWAAVTGSDEAARKVLLVFQAFVDDPRIPLNDAVAAMKKTN